MRKFVRKLTSLLLLVAAFHLSAQAQQSPSLYNSNRVERLETRPPASLPIQDPVVYPPGTNGAAAAGELDSREILNRMGRMYDRYARILDAAAADDHAEVERLLDEAMADLQQLIRHPEVVERPRFRELYRTVLTEYEQYYGAPADTLALPFGDIFTVRSEMFAAMNNLDDPLLEDVAFPPLGPVATTVPMTMNRLVQQSINYLVRSPEKHLYHWLERSQTYFPMIERILAEEGVPDELKYLAMIESGLNPRARSWASANGMWQFIAATGRAYDLHVNSWVDERLDPEKATRAAARHLKDLYEMFDGDWHLALAGYNCSPSRIRRAMARAERRLGRDATFWDIYNDIPRETRNYVPMFVAASLVASNPDAFGVDTDHIEPGPEYTYHYVPVRGFLSLDEIADMAGTSEPTVRALNPELRRSHVPPSNDAYYIRIPIGTYEQFAEAYSQLPPEKRRSTVTHTVRRGDVLGRIARKYGVSVSQLMRTNGLRGTTINIGQQLVVPVPSYDSSPLLADIKGKEVVTVDYGRPAVRPILADGAPERRTARRSRTTPIVKASTSAEASSPKRPSGDARDEREEEEPEEAESAEEGQTRIVYTVRRGDNLTEISRKYGVSVSDIRNWNGIAGSRIQAGQKLYLYEDNPAKASASTSTTVYRVRRGDTISEIARSYGVRASDIRRWNDLRTNTIRVGQRLTIHGTSAPTTYRVRRGDSLYVIARKHGVTIDDLKRWNSLTSSKIRPGQELKINS